MTGVPFEAIDRLETRGTVISARETINSKSDSPVQPSVIESLERELISARTALWEAARIFLPKYLVFAVGGVRHLLQDAEIGRSKPCIA